MGSSKVVLVGATSLIVGIYSLSIKKVETYYVKAAVERADIVQIDRLTEAAMRLALGQIANTSTRSRTVRNVSALGGSFDYTIKRQGRKSAQVTLTVRTGTVERTVKAFVNYTTEPRKNSMKTPSRGNWTVYKYFADKAQGRAVGRQ